LPVNSPAQTRSRRRRRRAGVGGLLLGALWMLGAGLGWFGTATRAPEERRAAPAVAPRPAPGAVEVRASRPAPKQQPVAAGEAEERALEPAPDAPEAAAARTAGIERDRFESLVSLLQVHVEHRRFGRAQALIDRLRAQLTEGDAAWRRLRRWGERVARGQEEVERELLTCLEAGEVLAADRLAALLEQSGSWRPAFAMRDVAALGDDWSKQPATLGLPDPAPIARGRRVRFELDGEILEGALLRSRAGRSTLRVTERGRQRFPTVADEAVEPVDATGEEAIDAALRAARAGAWRLARLWLFRARGTPAWSGARAEQLKAWLRGP